MRYLNKIIFLNSAHIPYAEVKLDGNVHFIGTQGVGKSTLLRALLFFYNADKLRLGIPKEKKSFDAFYFPYPNSYIVYEVMRENGAYCVLALKNQGRVMFRFIDAPFDSKWFIDERKQVYGEWSQIREQVGMIHTAMSEFCRIYPEYTATPTAVCSAMSQGYIGYDLQNAIRTELLGRGIYKTVSTILTQVVVDPYDEAFYHPTKIIGRVMTEAEAEEEEKKGNHVTQVEGGYRRVVAAPKPVDIVEKDAIKALVDADQVVIACGGGGIPVLAQDNKLQGASAVIEKDLAAGKLADTLDADRLVILTSVDKVCLNYGKEDEKPLDTMTVEEAKKYLAAGEFDEGTMAPKIEAAIDFIGDSAIRSVLITKLNKEGKTVSGGMGTLITK